MISETEKKLVHPPGYVEHQIDHYKQRYNWDCGVSCVLMLLTREQREDTVKNFSEVCQEEGFYQSTWTIDLCYLLKRYGIRHCLYTIMLGVNEEFQKYGYYDKIINMDRERVRDRFDKAPSAGIEVVESRLSINDILRHLATQGPVILLVDAGLLVCDLCKHNKLKAEFRRCFGGGYTGHYIVVVGYNARLGKLMYRDPALSARLCAASRARLDAARLAHGTDQDAILIFKSFV